eukprot:gnl/TRDRNA2_/TRDRNA2_170979_c0_seq1.p2 gnl/TRDRNA2_/TRDRNA2_170979_c0~~gnl/TRDRNA2_/TRDRNA2_170979_c0_seq1.p2  ORF type:complete len:111 (-),score=4.96 gnl/TRDRNA2_/TRDRNA2_170979_c0_seq1:94-426(-)
MTKVRRGRYQLLTSHDLLEDERTRAIHEKIAREERLAEHVHKELQGLRRIRVWAFVRKIYNVMLPKRFGQNHARHNAMLPTRACGTAAGKKCKVNGDQFEAHCVQGDRLA